MYVESEKMSLGVNEQIEKILKKDGGHQQNDKLGDPQK